MIPQGAGVYGFFPRPQLFTDIELIFFVLSDGTLAAFTSRTVLGCNILSAGYFIGNNSYQAFLTPDSLTCQAQV